MDRRIGKNPVIRNSNLNSRGLPFRGRPNSRYYGTDRNGKVDQVRNYNKKGTPKRDYDWNHAFRKDESRSRYHQVIPQDKFDKMFPDIQNKEFK